MKFIHIFYLFLVITVISCSVSKGIKDGETAFERKQYAVAVSLLEEEYGQSNTLSFKGRKAFLLGQSYLKLHNYNESAKWLDLAVKNEYGAEAIAAFAHISKILENYDIAISNYEKLRVMTGRKQEFDREILICKQALISRQKPVEYMIERIFENSAVSDYSPVLYEDEYLVFSSERQDATGKGVYNWTGEKFSDIFITIKSGSEVRRFDSSINTEHNEGTPWFSKDMNTLYFTRCFSTGNTDSKCKIMYTVRINDVWNEAVSLPFVKEEANYSQPTLIENDSVLVFSSDFEQPGGTTDLFYAELLEDGSWTEPEKLPVSINSQGNEKFPTGDGDTLYFSSDYLSGLGGYDIFKTYLKDDFSWATPVNMGYGINSGGDEFSFVVDYKARPKAGVTQQGFFTSSKPGTGKDDIYRFNKLIPIPEVPKDVVIHPDSSAKVIKSLFLTVKVFINEYTIPDDPNSQIASKKPLNAAFVRVLDQNNQKISEGYTNDNGLYYCAVPADTDLKITGMKLEYLSNASTVSTKNLIWKENETSKTINTELILDKIYLNKEINLSNIYYDYDKWDLKPEAIPTLNKLVTVLKENPRIKIQLSSHTDCRGAEDYNIVLSQKRAQSVVDYLIAHAIDPSRLMALGYGETLLIDTCICEQCTEDQHQSNRRTTFKIIN
ncbi:MAG: OmpA family protein [Saprospiraceae bacterium]|nr:OmpA family protein [Saprospiraceae bacterium]